MRRRREEREKESARYSDEEESEIAGEQANGLQAESVKYRERMYSRKIDDNKIEGGG